MEILKWCREYKTLKNVFASLCLFFSVSRSLPRTLWSHFSQPGLCNISVIFESHGQEMVFPTAHSLTRTYCPLYVRNES